MTAAHRGAVRDDRGAIAGVFGLAPTDGCRVVPADRRRHGHRSMAVSGGRTDGTGSFFIGRLSEGLHRVELDLENLPIELVPERDPLDRRSGARCGHSRWIFGSPEYGIAGRLTDARRRLGESPDRGRRVRDGLVIGHSSPTASASTGWTVCPSAPTPSALPTTPASTDRRPLG